jgi:hypothetical protein
MRKTVYTTSVTIVMMAFALGLSACHQQSSEPDNVPPADAGSVSTDSASADAPATDAANSATTADTN